MTFIPMRSLTRGASRRLLTRLAASAGKVVTYEALLFAMYAETDEGGPTDAMGSLRVLVHKMRKLFPPRAITSHYGVGYSLAPWAVPGWAMVAVDDAHVVLARSPRDEREFRGGR